MVLIPNKCGTALYTRNYYCHYMQLPSCKSTCLRSSKGQQALLGTCTRRTPSKNTQVASFTLSRKFLSEYAFVGSTGLHEHLECSVKRSFNNIKSKPRPGVLQFWRLVQWMPAQLQWNYLLHRQRFMIEQCSICHTNNVSHSSEACSACLTTPFWVAAHWLPSTFQEDDNVLSLSASLLFCHQNMSYRFKITKGTYSLNLMNF